MAARFDDTLPFRVLRAPPEVVDFLMEESWGGRSEKLQSLTSEARAAMVFILRRVNLDYLAEEVPDDPGFCMATEEVLDAAAREDGYDELRMSSDDWRLRIFRAPEGTLYDFNGWPGDNELGGGVFYPAGGGEPSLIFVNGDEDLSCDCDSEFECNLRWAAAVNEYYEWRIDSNHPDSVGEA